MDNTISYILAACTQAVVVINLIGVAAIMVAMLVKSVVDARRR